MNTTRDVLAEPLTSKLYLKFFICFIGHHLRRDLRQDQGDVRGTLEGNFGKFKKFPCFQDEACREY
jgi:hypothetical protein